MHQCVHSMASLQANLLESGPCPTGTALEGGERGTLTLARAWPAVRGEIVQLAGEIAKELAAGKEFPFKKIVMCNIGNPQQLGQKPITFFRQVVALCEYPQASPRAPQTSADTPRRCLEPHRMTECLPNKNECFLFVRGEPIRQSPEVSGEPIKLEGKF